MSITNGRSFEDELDAVLSGYCHGMEAVKFQKGTVFHGEGFNGIDEGSPFVWYYTMGKGQQGFLVAWPQGTRLRVQTHGPRGVILNQPECHTWWLDPAIEISVPGKRAA